jgi:hypothetical protein
MIKIKNSKTRIIKIYILLILIGLATLVFFLLVSLEEKDSGHFRSESKTSKESIQNKIFLGNYELVNNSDSLFFSVEDCWVENTPKYKDDILLSSNVNFLNFIFNIKFKKNSPLNTSNYTEKWIITTDNEMSCGRRGNQLFLSADNFDSEIQVKIIRLKNAYNYKHNENKTLFTLNFVKK